MEIIIDEKKYEVKDYLSMSEMRSLCKVSMDAFVNGLETIEREPLLDEISNYMGNPICFYEAFCMGLGSLCIENFDEELHQKLVREGKYENLINDIKNAKKTYEMANENLDRYFTLSNTLNRFLNEVSNKIPEATQLNEIVEKLPIEWNKVFEEYQSIIKPAK